MTEPQNLAYWQHQAKLQQARAQRLTRQLAAALTQYAGQVCVSKRKWQELRRLAQQAAAALPKASAAQPLTPRERLLQALSEAILHMQ